MAALTPGLHADMGVRRGSFDLAAALTIADGGVTAVLGPNGSGKTTLLHALAGLTSLAAGWIELARADDEPPVIWAAAAQGVHLPPQLRRVGLVQAEHLLFPHLSLRDNIAFGPRSRGIARAAAHARADEELHRVGLADLAGRRPAQVSSGQAQRAALARALATDPDVLLLDEPLSALDPQTRSATRADLQRRLSDFPGMAVLVTHDPLDALTLADHLVFLDGGRVTQSGTPAELIAAPRSPYAAQVVGLNLLRGTARVGIRVAVDVAGTEVVTAEDPSATRDGEDLWLTVSPAAVGLYDEPPHGSPRNAWPVTVRDVTLTGQRARVGLTGPVPLVAEVTAGAVAELGIVAGRQLWAAVKATEVTAYPAS